MTVVEAEKFKMTALGPLPPEWEVVKLGELLDTFRNGTTKRQNKDGKGYAVSRIETISTGLVNPVKVGYIESLTDDEVVNYRLRRGDILFSHINSEPYLGNSAIYRDNPPLLIHGMNLLVVRPNISQLGPEFLNFLFNYYRTTGVFVGIASRAVNQSSINQGKLKALLFPLPSILEQKKIAAVLSAIQEAKEKTEVVIRATRELKKSLMKHLFTYGPVSIDEAENLLLKKTEIGPVPEGWEVKPLVDIATLQRGKDLPKQKQVWGKHPVVGSSGVMAYHNQAPCKGPGVVTGRSGSIGNLTYVEEDYWPHNTGLYVRDFHNNNPKFTYYLLHLIDFKKYATGVSVPTLNRNFVHAATLPVPPIEVQQYIADILATVDRRIEAEENGKKALEALFKTLLSKLMTGKIRVAQLEVPV